MKKYYKYRKPHRYKRKKSVFKNRFFWLGISTISVLFSIFYFLFFSQTFQVKKIIVSGEEKISAEEIESLIPLKNIFLTDIGKIKQDILSRFPQIAILEVSRSFFDKINVSITEREAVALFCPNEDCFLIDKEGFSFKSVSSTTNLLKIEAAEITKEKLAQILGIKSRLAEVPKISVEEAVLASDERLNLKTSEGWEIYFNLKGNLNWQIQELNGVLEKQIPPEKRGKLEYIDLRFSRVYLKYYK